jgi:hypothetical protein
MEGVDLVMVIAPDRWALYELFLGRGPHFNPDVLSYLTKKCQLRSRISSQYKDLVTLCKRRIEKEEAIQKDSDRTNSAASIPHIAKTCAVLGETELIQRALKCCKAGASIGFFRGLGRTLASTSLDVITERYVH